MSPFDLLHQRKGSLSWKPFYLDFGCSPTILNLMARGCGIFREVGRQAPAGGAHIFLGGPNIFYVTVNAQHRVPWMDRSEVQNSLVDIWLNEAKAWQVGYYLIMPDHLHFFCAPYDLHFGIDRWISFWKARFSRRHLQQPWAWQRRAFHHRLRDRVEYEEKLLYVQENPVRRNLVKSSCEWSFQGRVYDIWWTGD